MFRWLLRDCSRSDCVVQAGVVMTWMVDVVG